MSRSDTMPMPESTAHCEPVTAKPLPPELEKELESYSVLPTIKSRKKPRNFLRARESISGFLRLPSLSESEKSSISSTGKGSTIQSAV
jgi:hypothetical protein